MDGLSFINNSITRSYAYEPWHPQKQNFLFEACKNVIIKGNTIGDDVLGKNILLRAMSQDEMHLSNTELVIEELDNSDR